MIYDFCITTKLLHGNLPLFLVILYDSQTVPLRDSNEVVYFEKAFSDEMEHKQEPR